MDYNKEMEMIIEKLQTKPKLLLHSCCAPCSSHCLLLLAPFFEITVFYFNPNISPFEEYEKRVIEQKRFIDEINKEFGYNISYVDSPYDSTPFYNKIKGQEELKEGQARCYNCYYLRLEETAKYAKENQFDYFCTTLSVSPYKNSNWINEIGKELEKKYNILFLPSDFKKKEGYKHSIALSKQYNLYRQHYCGCEFSRRDFNEK